MVYGEIVDCGDTPPRFMSAPPRPIGNGFYTEGDFPYLPLLTTLRALGLEVGEVSSGETDIRCGDYTYRLSIPNKTLYSINNPRFPPEINRFYATAGGYMRTEVVGDEIMVNTNTLFYSILYSMCDYEYHFTIREDREAGTIRIETRAP